MNLQAPGRDQPWIGAREGAAGGIDAAVKAAENDMAPADTVAEQALRLFRPDHPAAALGLAVSHLMTKPAFARLAFGDWSRILVGQINRKHYCFVVDGAGRVQGFMGWALAGEEHARAWAEGSRALMFEDSRNGDCVVVNAFSADSTKVTRFLIEQARRMFKDKTALYFKRHYKDGTTRIVRVPVNEFVNAHIARRDAGNAVASAA